MADNEKTIIARIQNRRGLKQDLPKPLRPGEFGFATDSRQLYIGAETENPLADSFNKTLEFENTLGAQVTTSTLANNSIIRFTVPHKHYERGFFDGSTKLVTWAPTSNTVLGSSEPVFSSSITGGANANSAIRSMDSNSTFISTDLTIMRDSTLLVGDNANSTPSPAYDYSASTSLDSSVSHSLILRTAPLSTESLAITYYSNTSIVSAIESEDFISPRSSLLGFYGTYDIPESRKFDTSLIRISPTTGVGHIGFKYNQIAVYVGGITPAAGLTGLTLGNVFCSRESDAVALSANVNSDSSNIVVDIAGHSYTTSGQYRKAFVETTTSWLNEKVLNVIDTSNTTITLEIPTSTFVGYRNIVANVAGNTVTLRGNVEGIANGDTVFIIDDAAGPLNGTAEVISNVSLAPGTDLGTFTIDAPGISNVTANLYYVNRGNISTLGVGYLQLYTESHGYPTGSLANFDGFLAGAKTVASPTTNTLFIDTGGTVGSKIAGNIMPGEDNVSFTSAQLSITPVQAVDLSNVTSLAGVVSTFDDLEDWPQISYIPDSATTLYFTHKNAYASTGISMRLFEDDANTLSTLGLTEGYASKTNTVKAKFERWLNLMLADADINLFNSAQANEKYSISSTSNIGTWDLNIDTTTNEMVLGSRHEAANFADILNRTYYSTYNSDLRGLVTMKTNIEVLTAGALSTGVSILSFNDPTAVFIENGVTTLSSLELDAEIYNNRIIEYSLKDQNTGSNINFKRIGQILITADTDQDSGNGAVTLTDVSTEISEGYTGNITFSAEMSGSSIIFNANNTLSPTSTATMSFIERRWKD